MARLRSACPAEECRAAAPQQSKISSEQLLAAGASGDWLGLAPMRCNYCGCVYTGAGPEKVIWGWYDSMRGPGWNPEGR